MGRRNIENCASAIIEYIESSNATTPYLAVKYHVGHDFLSVKEAIDLAAERLGWVVPQLEEKIQERVKRNILESRERWRYGYSRY